LWFHGFAKISTPLSTDEGLALFYSCQNAIAILADLMMARFETNRAVYNSASCPTHFVGYSLAIGKHIGLQHDILDSIVKFSSL
jgi:hypothetical protein